MGSSGEHRGNAFQHANMQRGNSRFMLPHDVYFTDLNMYGIYPETPAPLQPLDDTFMAAVGAAKTIHGTAHDDSSCLESCNGAGYLSGPQHFIRGAGANTLARHKSSSTVPAENPYVQHALFPYGLQGSSMNYGDGAIFSPYQDEPLEHQTWSHIFDQLAPAVSHQDGVAGTQKAFRDDDNRSEACTATTCDSHCDLSDPCTGEACANEVDACTDRNCPEKNYPDASVPSKLPAEVVNAAATLATIGVGPDFQEQSYDISRQAFPTPALPESQGPLNQDFGLTSLLEPSLVDISQHLFWAHRDPNSSDCTRPCPVDNPMVFEHCHFPNNFNTDPTFNPSFANINPFSAGGGNSYGNIHAVPHNRILRMKRENCGREISNPDEFVNHFNAEHRRAFTASMLSGGMTREMLPNLLTRHEPSPYSTNTLPSSLSSTPHTSSPQEPFPPTPQSLQQQPGAGSRLDLICHSRSSSAAQLTAGTHKCLWCDEEDGEPCGLVFTDPEDLHLHVSSKHTKTLEKRGTDGFVCCWENCKRDGGGKKGFPQRSKILRHMQTHIGCKPFQCEVCGNRFSARQALEQHKLIHTNEKPLKCDWPGCEQTFRQQSALTMHKRTHTKEKPLTCPHCGKAFSESSNLSKHKRIHEGKGKFTCDQVGCEKSFHRKDQLRRHLQLHKQKEEMLGGRRLSTMSSVSGEGGEDGLQELESSPVEDMSMFSGIGVSRAASEFEDVRAAKRQRV